MVQWLRLHASTARVADLTPGGGTKIPHASQYWTQKKKQMTVISPPRVSELGEHLPGRILSYQAYFF